MLLRDLTQVWVSEYETINDHGEKKKIWKYKSTAWLNLQQDVNELDKKSTGEVDYSIYKARTTQGYDIKKGNGVSFTDISKSEEFKPDYRVLDHNKIGSTSVYRLEVLQ